MQYRVNNCDVRSQSILCNSSAVVYRSTIDFLRHPDHVLVCQTRWHTSPTIFTISSQTLVSLLESYRRPPPGDFLIFCLCTTASTSSLMTPHFAVLLATSCSQAIRVLDLRCSVRFAPGVSRQSFIHVVVLLIYSHVFAFTRVLLDDRVY